MILNPPSEDTKKGAKTMFKNEKLRAIIQFICLCAGGWSIYQVTYMRYSYYDAFIEAFSMTNEQFGILFSVYGTLTILTYFIGGVIADKISPRKLLTFSFISTGLLNLWFGTLPGYNMALVIYALLGITSTMTFWAALIKATRQVGKVIGEGKALGGLEAGRQLFNMVVGTALVFWFGRFASMTLGLKAVINFYGIFLIAVGILTFLSFTEEKSDASIENPFKVAKECLKNKNIWVMSLIILGAYAVTSSVTGYISNYSTSVLGISVAAAAFIGMFQAYFSPLGALGGGVIADKIGISKMLLIGALGLVVTVLLIGYLPAGAGMVVLFLAVFAVFNIFMGVARGLYYGTMKEAGIPMRLSGTAIGVMATIGYTPDIFLSPIIGRILDNNINAPDVGYKIIFTILAGFGLFCAIMLLVFRRMNRENIAKLDQERRDLKAAKTTQSIEVA
jgi:nitrate/nitrite transporter NarK